MEVDPWWARRSRLGEVLVEEGRDVDTDLLQERNAIETRRVRGQVAGRTAASDSAVSSTPAGAIATIARRRSSLSAGMPAGNGSIASPGRPRLQKIGSADASARQCLRIRDKSGLAGGNTNRPTLERRLTDVEDGRIDVVVVYMIDRLTLNILMALAQLEREVTRPAPSDSV